MIDPQDWTVAIDNVGANVTFRPDVVGDPERQPSLLNAGLPEVRIPVERDTKWQASQFDEAPMRVYDAGEKQPIEELDRTVVQNGQTILIGQGGRELLDRVELSVDTRRIHRLIEDLISNNTSYTPDVTVPRADTEEDVVQQNPDTTSEWENNTPSIPATKPVDIVNGVLLTRQTSVLLEAEQFGPQAGGIAVNSNASAGEEAILDGSSVGQFYEFTFTPDYDVPSGEGLPLLRLRATGPDPPGFEVTVDGTSVYDIAAGGYLIETLEWLFEDTSELNGTPPAVTAGDTVTVRIEITASGSDDINVDLGGWADGRYNYTFDNEVNTDGYLAGPEPYPEAISQKLSAFSTTQAATAARVQATMAGGSTLRELAISPDGGATFPYTSQDSAALFRLFDDLTTDIQVRVTMGREGSGRQETPTSGYTRQSIDALRVSADLSSIPVVVDQRYDNDLLTVLQDLLQKGDMLAEYRDDGTTKSVDVAQPGQRVTDSDVSVSNYEVTKQATTYEKVVVEGSGDGVDGESVTLVHGSAVALVNDTLVPNTERVYDGGTTYERGTDYEIDYQAGEVTALASGSITDGATVSIDYRYKITGSATADGVSTPNRTFKETFSDLTTQRAADQAAEILVRNLKTPRYEATVTLPADETGWSLLDDIDPPEVPTGEQSLEVESAQTTADGIRLRLGSRDSAEELVGRIQSRLAAVSGRV